MVERRKVLVIGLSGVVGSAIRHALDERYHVSSLSRRGVPGLPGDRDFRADIADRERIRSAFTGVDTVLHLAATGGVHSPRGSRTGFVELLPVNIVGTYNVFEAAVDAGVRRLVFASSGSIVRGYERILPYRDLVSGRREGIPRGVSRLTKDAEPRPLSLYAVTKLFGEALGRYYAETTTLSVLCLRIGSVRSDNRPRDQRGLAVYLSHRDLIELVVRSIEAPASVHFDVFYGVSDNTRGYRDLSHAREVLGYVPRDDAEFFAERNHADDST